MYAVMNLNITCLELAFAACVVIVLETRGDSLRTMITQPAISTLNRLCEFVYSHISIKPPNAQEAIFFYPTT